MFRSIVRLLVFPGLIVLAGCNSRSGLPENPTVDNRPPEIKEADDAMEKHAAKVSAGLKKH